MRSSQLQLRFVLAPSQHQGRKFAKLFSRAHGFGEDAKANICASALLTFLKQARRPLPTAEARRGAQQCVEPLLSCDPLYVCAVHQRRSVKFEHRWRKITSKDFIVHQAEPENSFPCPPRYDKLPPNDL